LGWPLGTVDLGATYGEGPRARAKGRLGIAIIRSYEGFGGSGSALHGDAEPLNRPVGVGPGQVRAPAAFEVCVGFRQRNAARQEGACAEGLRAESGASATSSATVLVRTQPDQRRDEQGVLALEGFEIDSARGEERGLSREGEPPCEPPGPMEARTEPRPPKWLNSDRARYRVLEMALLAGKGR
jgi:hypothetical protein